MVMTVMMVMMMLMMNGCYDDSFTLHSSPISGVSPIMAETVGCDAPSALSNLLHSPLLATTIWSVLAIQVLNNYRGDLENRPALRNQTNILRRLND